jgi:hypothetical protein
MSSRVELLPQSKAASASGTNVIDYVGAYFDRAGDEIPDGIVMTREMMSEVRMEALHPDARAAHPTAGLRQIRAHGRGGSPLGVLIVSSLEIFCVDELLESVHATFALEATHRVVQFWVHKPVQRRHGSAIAKVRFVFDHDWAAVVASNYDGESPGEGST